LNNEIRLGKRFSLNPNFSYVVREERDYEIKPVTAARRYNEDEGDLVTARLQANVLFNETFTLSGYYEYQFVSNELNGYTTDTPQPGNINDPTRYDPDVTQLFGIKTIFEF